MTTTTEFHTSVVPDFKQLFRDVAGSFESDFDIDQCVTDYLGYVNSKLPQGVSIYRNGMVLHDIDVPVSDDLLRNALDGVDAIDVLQDNEIVGE
jgi:hypothetical protein